MNRKTILTIAAMGLLAWLFLGRRNKSKPASGKTVLGADGRIYRLISPATQNGDGSGSPSIWRGPDGKDYFPDLGWDLGTSQAPPLMRSFGG